MDLWRPALKRLRLPVVGVHALRHSAAARMISPTWSLLNCYFLESEDPDKDISLYVNLPGGHAYAGLAIYESMQYVKPDVSTICVGMAISLGAIMLCGGATSKRFALPNAKIMIHQGSTRTR